MNKNAILKTLNRILELELSSVAHYTNYARMAYSNNGAPVVDWLRKRIDEGLDHAQQADELGTWLDGHPLPDIGTLLETFTHDIGDIPRESLALETEILKAYYELLKLTKDKGTQLEEYAKSMLAAKTVQQDTVYMMLRKPNTVGRTALDVTARLGGAGV